MINDILTDFGENVWGGVWGHCRGGWEAPEGGEQVFEQAGKLWDDIVP